MNTAVTATAVICISIRVLDSSLGKLDPKFGLQHSTYKHTCTHVHTHIHTQLESVAYSETVTGTLEPFQSSVI